MLVKNFNSWAVWQCLQWLWKLGLISANRHLRLARNLRQLDTLQMIWQNNNNNNNYNKQHNYTKHFTSH